MAKQKTDIWMPLYIGDYLADTSRLSTEQHGAYLLLLMDYWRNGPLPNDAALLAQITRMTPDAWSIAQALLLHFFFVAEDGLLHNKRIDEEISSAGARKEKNELRAKKAAEARWSDATSNAPSIPSSTPQAMLEQCPSPSPSQEEQKISLVELENEPAGVELRGAVEQVFDFYLEKVRRDKARYALTSKRMAKGMVCLRECIKRSDGDVVKACNLMCDAVEGLVNNAWLMGRDSRSTKAYIEWEDHVFRDVETMEKRWDDFQRKAS